MPVDIPDEIFYQSIPSVKNVAKRVCRYLKQPQAAPTYEEFDEDLQLATLRLFPDSDHEKVVVYVFINMEVSPKDLTTLEPKAIISP